jgi:hypothetical protein
MPIRSIYILIVCCAVSGFPLPLWAHPVLTFSVASHVEPAPGHADKPTDETFPLVVTLGHRFFSTEAKDVRTIYDFERYRILRVNLRAKTFEDDSLYSDVGFRVLEFYNRMQLGNALRSANIKSPVSPEALQHFDVALVENLFSLADDKSRTVVDARKVKGATEYHWQQYTLMTVGDRTKPIPTEYQTEYWRFFRYYAGGHPRILESLASAKGVPERSIIVLSNFKAETRTLTLQSIATPPDAPYSLDGFTLAQPDREPYSTLKLIGADAPHELQLRVETALKDRDSAFAQGKYLDAFLANQEAALSTGESTIDWLRSARDKLNADPEVMRVAAALGKHDAGQAPRLADELASVRALAPAHVEVLEIFEGNTRLEFGEAQGLGLLLSAARADPYLTGVWRDLGDHYYRSFHMAEAWACLDAARRIAPNHPMLKPADDMERALRAKNPEYF